MLKKSVLLFMFIGLNSTLFSFHEIKVRNLENKEISIIPGEKGILGADIKKMFVQKMDELDRSYFSNYGPLLHDSHLSLFTITNDGKLVEDNHRITSTNTNGRLIIDTKNFTERLKETGKILFNGLDNKMMVEIFMIGNSVQDRDTSMNTGVSLRRAVFNSLYKKNENFFKNYGTELKDEDLGLLKILSQGNVLDIHFVGPVLSDKLHFLDTALRKKIEELNEAAQEYQKAASSFIDRFAQRIKTVEQQVVDAAESVAFAVEEELD